MKIDKFDKFNEEKGEKWIQDAIKKPGSLRKSLKKKKDEKITKGEIESELRELRKKDKDPSKKGIQGLSKRDLSKLRKLNLAKTLKGMNENHDVEHYMFFANLETIKRLTDEMLSMDKNELDELLKQHDWASDHISTSKDDVEEVFNFIASHKERETSSGIERFSDFGKEVIEESQLNENNQSKLYGMNFSGVSESDFKRYQDMMDNMYNSGDMMAADELLTDLEFNYPDIFNRYEDNIKDLIFGM